MLWGSLLCSYKDCLMCEQWQAFFRVRRLVVADVDVLLNSLFKEGLITPAAVRVSVEQLPAFSPSQRSCPSEEGSQMQVGILRINYFHPNWNDSDESVFPPELSTPEAGEPASNFSLLPTGVGLKGTWNSVLETASCGFQPDTRFHFYWMIRMTFGLGFEIGGKVMTWWFFYDCCRSQSHQENSQEKVCSDSTPLPKESKLECRERREASGRMSTGVRVRERDHSETEWELHDAVTIVCSCSNTNQEGRCVGDCPYVQQGPNLPLQHGIRNRVVMTLQSSPRLSLLPCWCPPNTFHDSLGKPHLEKKNIGVIVPFQAQMSVELEAEEGEEGKRPERLVFSFQTLSPGPRK